MGVVTLTHSKEVDHLIIRGAHAVVEDGVHPRVGEALVASERAAPHIRCPLSREDVEMLMEADDDILLKERLNPFLLGLVEAEVIGRHSVDLFLQWILHVVSVVFKIAPGRVAIPLLIPAQTRSIELLS